MAYTQRVDGKKGTRYRGFYKDADGHYKSAGAYDTEERALEVAQTAEKHAAALISGAIGGLDPVTRATRTIEEYAPIFMRHHRVEGNTKDTYADTLRLHIIPFLAKARLAETDRTVARNYFTALGRPRRHGPPLSPPSAAPRQPATTRPNFSLPSRPPASWPPPAV
jgi:hypothetical protein